MSNENIMTKLHPDIENYIAEFKRNIRDVEIECQELDFDTLTPEEDAEIDKLDDLAVSLQRQAI